MRLLREALSINSTELLRATARFAEEDRPRSWRLFISTFLILLTLLVLAAVAPWWPLRLAASILGGLTIVRAFILYHDFLHGAILSGSRVAGVLFYIFGLVALTPARYWRHGHNFHHAHVGKIILSKPGAFPLLTSDTGSFPLMTSIQWKEASNWHRLRYRVTRHPLTILSAYFTVFVLVNCLFPLFKRPRKYWDGALSLTVHFALLALLWVSGGMDVAVFALILPFGIASMIGAYLFYVQHTYKSLRIVPREDWTYEKGALESSTYLRLGPVMRWFTGNIGFHHAHHVNPHIPFYRLPEAMEALPALQHPPVTTLHPRDILSSFQANLWDRDHGKMISYREAARLASLR